MMTILSWSRELLVTLTKQLNSLLAFTHCAIHQIIFINIYTQVFDEILIFKVYRQVLGTKFPLLYIHSPVTLYFIYCITLCGNEPLCLLSIHRCVLLITVSSRQLRDRRNLVTNVSSHSASPIFLHFFVHTFRGCRQEGLGVVSGDMEAGCSLSRLSPLSCH